MAEQHRTVVTRASALPGPPPARFGGDDGARVRLQEVPELTLWQVTAWPETLEAVGQAAAKAAGVDKAPGPGASLVAESNSQTSNAATTALLRVEPLKWWLLTPSPNLNPNLNPTLGTTLDLSHSRTRIRITGPDTPLMLNRLIPIDLRHAAFPPAAVASTTLHHSHVTLWHSPHGHDLFIPRGVARALWEVMVETAKQFQERAQ